MIPEKVKYKNVATKILEHLAKKIKKGEYDEKFDYYNMHNALEVVKEIEIDGVIFKLTENNEAVFVFNY